MGKNKTPLSLNGNLNKIMKSFLNLELNQTLFTLNAINYR